MINGFSNSQVTNPLCGHVSSVLRLGIWSVSEIYRAESHCGLLLKWTCMSCFCDSFVIWNGMHSCAFFEYYCLTSSQYLFPVLPGDWHIPFKPEASIFHCFMCVPMIVWMPMVMRVFMWMSPWVVTNIPSCKKWKYNDHCDGDDADGMMMMLLIMMKMVMLMVSMIIISYH